MIRTILRNLMPCWGLVVAVTLLLAACGGSAKRSSDLLYDVRAYNEGVRWVKLPQAAVRILPSEREAFLDEREQLEEELRIDDYEITRLKMNGDRQETAEVQIRWSWHMDSKGIVRSTTSKQEWRRFGSRWLMLKEAHVRGDEMPGIPASEEDPESLDAEQDEQANESSSAVIDAHQTMVEKREPFLLAQRNVEAALRDVETSHRIAE